jgi:hypothetical protein
MRLFHKSRPARPALQRRVPRSWDPPQTEFPGVVPINTLELGRSEQAAVAITGMSAYSNGFEIFVTALIRPGHPGFEAETLDGGVLADKPYRISLQLSDGRTVTSGQPPGDSEPTGRSCGYAAAVAPRTVGTPSCGPGHCRQAGRWSSSATGRRSGPAIAGSASTRN